MYGKIVRVAQSQTAAENRTAARRAARRTPMKRVQCGRGDPGIRGFRPAGSSARPVCIIRVTATGKELQFDRPPPRSRPMFFEPAGSGCSVRAMNVSAGNTACSRFSCINRNLPVDRE